MDLEYKGVLSYSQSISEKVFVGDCRANETETTE